MIFALNIRGILRKNETTLSISKSYFAQGSRRKATIILAQRIPQVSRQSQLYSPVWFGASFNAVALNRKFKQRRQRSKRGDFKALKM